MLRFICGPRSIRGSPAGVNGFLPTLGDTAPSVAPEIEAPAPRPEPESTTDCNGRWEGDEIVISNDEEVGVFLLRR